MPNISSKNNLFPNSFTDKMINLQTKAHKSKSVSPSNIPHYTIPESSESGDQDPRTPQAGILKNNYNP